VFTLKFGFFNRDLKEFGQKTTVDFEIKGKEHAVLQSVEKELLGIT